MSLYYCETCKNAFLPEKTYTDGSQLFCQKCDIVLISLGSEDGRVSLQGHIESQQTVSASNIYHNFSQIKSKHYKAPKKDPILIDCESKLALDPLNIEALFTLSQWYYSQGLTQEAIAIAKQIIKIEPTYHKAHEFLSRQKLNQLRQKTTLPEDINTLEGMAVNFVNSKQFDKAEDALKKILSINSKHPAARRYLADIYSETGQLNEAIHQLNRLSMQYPDDERILFNLAVACYNANDIQRAISNLKAAKKLCKDPEFIDEIQKFIRYIDKNKPS